MNRKTGLIATIVTAVLCGCPGLCSFCMGFMFAGISFVPGAEIDVFGSTALVSAFANAPGLLEEEFIDTGEVYAVDLLCQL